MNSSCPVDNWTGSNILGLYPLDASSILLQCDTQSVSRQGPVSPGEQ